MTRVSLLLLGSTGLLLAGATGCATPPETSRPMSTVWETPPRPADAGRESAAVPPPAAAAEQVEPTEHRQSQPLAVVNGRPISRQAMVDMLIEGHGLRLLEELVLLEAARQRSSQMSLKVSERDILAAHEDALSQVSTPVNEDVDASLDRTAAERLLDEFLVAKNISRTEWNLRMEQRAHLRKIAEAEVATIEVTEKMLRQEYNLLHGERVRVRHIQVASPAASAKVRRLLEQGESFELLARKMSENRLTAANGGLLPAFTASDNSVPPLIRDTALSLKVGEVSAPLREDNWYHLIRVEERIPASGPGFENADGQQLRARLVGRLVAQRQQELETELFRSARVEIRDQEIRRQFQARYPDLGSRSGVSSRMP